MQGRIQVFTTTFNARTHVLFNNVYISQAFDLSSFPTVPNLKDLSAKKFMAIWDTGATGTVITQKVIDDCGLKPIGITRVNTASAKGKLTTVYFASIVLPNKVIIPQLRVTKGTITGNAEVLIGMDIISHGDLAVTNYGGKTVFSFRMPSIECIDFRKQKLSVMAPQISQSSPKVGRNDPCPCGSGKKYKKCCGR